MGTGYRFPQKKENVGRQLSEPVERPAYFLVLRDLDPACPGDLAACTAVTGLDGDILYVKYFAQLEFRLDFQKKCIL